MGRWWSAWLVAAGLAWGLPAAAVTAQPGAPAAAAAARGAAARTAVTVPYQPLREHGMPLIQVRLGDRVAAPFAFDTGANASAISDTLARHLGLRPLPAVGPDGQPISLGPRMGMLHMVTVPRFEIGALRLADVPMPVLDERILRELSPGGLGGIIGADLCRRWAVRIDPEQRQATFWPGGRLAADEVSGAGFTPSAIALEDDPRDQSFYVHLRLNERATERCLLDTGALMTAISPNTARQLRLRPSGPGIPLGSFYGPVMLDQGTVATLSLGAVAIRNAPVAWPRRDPREVPPILGQDVLAGHRILFDFPSRAMYLQPLRPAPRAGGRAPAPGALE